jgi:hypothetical protein
VRVPDDPVARFPAVVAAAEAVLEVATEPKTDATDANTD